MTASLPSTCGDAPLHRLGMGLSALCLIHCIALPWLLTILPAAILSTLPGALRDSEWLHAGLIMPVLLVSGPVLLRGSPGRWQTGLTLVGFAAMILGLFAGSDGAEQALTVTGAAFVMAAHAFRLRRAHRH